MLVGTYNPWLVAISLLVAVMASYTALAMAGRTITAPGKAAAWWWRLGGGFAMGLGIWSMHFIGMLAFDLPIPLGYDLPITLLSLALAIASSVFALWLVSLRTLPHPRLAGGALLMGTGIAGMHYVGMAAMRMQPCIDYDPGWLLLSLMVAVAASWTTLYVAFRLRGQRTRIGDRLAAAGLLGLAIVGMHYTGMAAARFPEGSICGAAVGDGLQSEWLAMLVVVLSVAILAVVLVVSRLDQRVEAQLLRLRNSMLSTSLTDAQQELTQAALHDPLTRLPNRLLLQRRIVQALAEAEQGGSRFAVMFMDPTASSRSTMPTATRPAMHCWWRWPSAPASCCGPTICWHDWAVTSSCWWYASNTTRTCPPSPGASCRRWAAARCCRTTNCR